MNNFFANLGNDQIKSFTNNSTFLKPPNMLLRNIFQINQVSETKISDYIKNLNNSTSVVPDNNSNNIFKNCHDLIAKNIACIVNQSINTSKVPDDLKIKW